MWSIVPRPEVDVAIGGSDDNHGAAWYACYLGDKINDLESGVRAMTYTGHVEKGAIVLDEPVALPDGALVRIELTGEPLTVGGNHDLSFTERFSSVVGKARSLPEDAAENHDSSPDSCYSAADRTRNGH
jgi:hypothetical protein